MLMVLMALVELGRTRVYRATRWLWLLFSGGLFVAPAGCWSSDTGGELSAADDVVGGDPGTDLSQVLYGPAMDYLPPLETVDTAVFDLAQVMYGPAMDLTPVPTDVPDEVVPPQDVVQPTDVPLEFLDVVPADAPTDVPLDCGNMTYYGPPPPYGPMPCQTDEMCVSWYGAGSRCVTDACGTASCTAPTDADVPPETMDAPDCGVIAIAYGPMIVTCQTDQECVDQMGAGWYCDKADPCVPMCRTK